MGEQEIPKAYNPKEVEDAVYARWEKSGFFNPDVLRARYEPTNKPRTHEQRSWWRYLRGLLQTTIYKLQTPFTIVMPPPNVTGTLHVGHAVMLALEDIMIRFARMRARPTLWVPGTDHAAIATQNVVEKKLIKEGMKDPRGELGREKFLGEVEKFARVSHDRIVTQIKKMGASCDWSREAYTLDPARSLAVRTIFKMMHDDGLIYRGNRIVNWCPRCTSTLADDEVLYREETTPFYYFKYGPVVIGTARPETKFADKTIVVHPDDERYKNLHGTSFDVEWIEGVVKSNVIADPVIDPKFGTGAMTITPGHSFEDFDLAQKYKLPVIKIIDEDGNLTGAAGSFAGKSARASRAAIVRKLKEKGLVDHIDENYLHNLSICYRCETPVEPLPTLQWFIDVNKKVRGASLKERMREVVANGEIKIIPERFTKEYFRWIDNLRDWCISRQIWFGHRIPVWYHEPKCVPKPGHEHDMEKCQEMVVAFEKPVCEFCNAEYVQDPDTLDTWFSSGLWTFSTLGWPQKTRDLERFHPTSVLETGYDILFFWIARMVMMTTYALGEVPFRTVYLHGLVRDEQGRKMSKSVGNVIDPLDMIEKYGADATRLSLVIGTAPGNDVKLSEAKIAGFRNFTNKLWNIARFILEKTENARVSSSDLIRGASLDSRLRGNDKKLTLADQWILNELDRVTAGVTVHLERYEFSAAGELLRDFTWGSLADWYLEIAKQQLLTTHYSLPTQTILRHCLERVLKLWHPFMPFVTEVMWERMARTPLLIVAPWPETQFKEDREVMRRFRLVQSIVTTVRSVRADYHIDPSKQVPVTVSAGSDAAWMLREASTITALARVSSLAIHERVARPPSSATIVLGAVEVSIVLTGLIDIAKERERVTKEIKEMQNYLDGVRMKLNNKEFAARAPAAVIKEYRTKLSEADSRLVKLAEQQRALEL
ncbi:valine--tRNA ligase [Candidatus Uhrbacteria bacterium]|nr:valine--tRNA ligase [Candidatus Uhrbacteria bacterium]